MVENIINSKIIKEKEQKVLKNIAIITYVIVFLLIMKIFLFRNVDTPYLESTLFFIRTFNFILCILAYGSCLISYNRIKIDTVFIVSLMYLGLSIGILFGQIDYFSFYENEFNINNYIIVSTSLIRVTLLLTAVSQNNHFKKIIMENKLNSAVLVIVATILLGIVEKNISAPLIYSVEFCVIYNIFLTIVYIYSAIKLFKIGIKEKEYLFIVLSASVFMLAIKAIYGIYGSFVTSFYIKVISVSITYFISLLVIGGTFIELYIYINRFSLVNENLKLFHNIVDNNKHSFMIITDESGKTLYVNKKTKEYYSNSQYKDLSNINLRFNDISVAVGKEKEIIKSLQNVGTWRGTIRNDLDEITLDCAMQLIETNRKEKEIAISCMDISETVRTELELEKLKVYTNERTEFISNISHELRTPVNIFYSTLQLLDLLEKKEDTDFRLLYDKYKKTLNVNCKRMLRLINNVIDISKIDSGLLKGNFDDYNIVAIVEDVTLSVVNYAKLKLINIEFDTQDEEIITKCDPSLIERAMLNLLSNAIKFSKEKSNIYVNIIGNDDYVEIFIKDEGRGISKKDKKVIFDRFIQGDKSLTRDNEGSGIGLSIVKSIVDLHNGYINLDSEIDKGSIFKIILPRNNETNKEYKIYDINDYNTELELSDIYEILI